MNGFYVREVRITIRKFITDTRRRCIFNLIIHPEDEEEVIKKALQKYESEKDILQRILDGESTMSIYGFDKLVEELKK